MITNVSGTVFQLIHYFPGKQGLPINLLWPALQCKQHMYVEFVDITRNMFIWTSSADQCGFSSCWHLRPGREVEIIEHLNSINGQPEIFWSGRKQYYLGF